MGQSRFLSRGLIAALFLFGACGGDDDLLRKADTDEIYSGGGGGSNYFASSTNTADFGVVTGKVSYEGRRRRRKESIYKDFCINANPNGILSEDFLVGGNGELAGVVVYVKRGLNKVSFPAPSEPVVLDQKACRYVPHIAVVQFGQDLIIRNSDEHEHNVHWMPGTNGEFNTPMNVPGDLEPKSFNKQQVAASIKCDIHGWMQSYVAVLPHPCWAITKADGTFTIRGVPPGTLLLAAWHEELGELEVEIATQKSGTLNQNFTYPGK
jgi:hypothetical protein